MADEIKTSARTEAALTGLPLVDVLEERARPPLTFEAFEAKASPLADLEPGATFEDICGYRMRLERRAEGTGNHICRDLNRPHPKWPHLAVTYSPDALVIPLEPEGL